GRTRCPARPATCIAAYDPRVAGELDRLSNIVQRATESIHGSRSYGPVVEKDGVTLVPVSFVVGGGGGGGGAPPPHPMMPADEQGQRVGAGGGFGFVSWPIGAYVIRNGEVKWQPSIDAGMLALVASGLLRSVLRRRRRRLGRG